MSRKIDCMETECCDCIEIHGDCIKKVMERMPAEETLNDLAALFKVFGDPTRVKILYVLFQSELCVCDLAEVLHMTQSAISHQLRILKDANLVGNRREGKTVYYFLSDDHVRTIIAQGFEHLIEESNEIGTIER